MRTGRGRIFDDPERLHEMLALYQAGKGLKELGRLFGCDHGSILYQVKKHGVWVKQPPGGVRKPKAPKQVIAIEPPEAEPPPPPAPPSPPKYDHLFDELQRPGKSYQEYRKEAERRAAKSREAHLERLRAEKV